METSKINRLRTVLKSLSVNTKSGYATGKGTILKVFRSLKENSKEDILAKLTLIDSMYSTQMNRRYYGLEELSDVLVELKEKKGNLSDLFLTFLKEKKIEIFTINHCGKSKNLFFENYGIGKDGKDKGLAISLISKFAYFETNLNFPIYDSIVREMYPLIWAYCDFPKKEMPPKRSLVNDMVAYIDAIDLLKHKIGKLLHQQSLTYENLDKLLWHTGKILRGNLSLILTMEDYQQYGKEFQKKNFDLSTYDLSQLAFLEHKPMLKHVFEFAKELSILN